MDGVIQCERGEVVCYSNEQPAEASDEKPAVDAGLPTPGLSDVAKFLAVRPKVTAEPGEWTLAGYPTNFVAGDAAQQKAGELLGHEVTVRFTPTAYTWDYGDGTSRTLAAAGRTWAQLGQEQFTETPTSHVYAARGTYTVTVTVGFTAQYRFDGQDAWSQVPGTLALTSAPVTVTAKGVKVVLVNEDCNENPTGPGC